MKQADHIIEEKKVETVVVKETSQVKREAGKTGGKKSDSKKEKKEVVSEIKPKEAQKVKPANIEWGAFKM